MFWHRLFILGTLAFLFIFSGAIAYARDGNYGDAKKLLENYIYADHRVTLYCGAKFDSRKNILLPAGFKAPSNQSRSGRVEWEHAVPAENFGRAFSEWRDGDPMCVSADGKRYKGRKCASKASLEFRQMEADMHNLFPAIGSVNAVRGNKQYSELPGESSAFGACKAKVDGKRFEPPDRAKGIVARAALYMDSQYPHYNLSRQQKRLFSVWDRQFPPDRWECTRARRIERVQGNANKFVNLPCEKLGL